MSWGVDGPGTRAPPRTTTGVKSGTRNTMTSSIGEIYQSLNQSLIFPSNTQTCVLFHCMMLKMIPMIRSIWNPPSGTVFLNSKYGNFWSVPTPCWISVWLHFPKIKQKERCNQNGSAQWGLRGINLLCHSFPSLSAYSTSPFYSLLRFPSHLASLLPRLPLSLFSAPLPLNH